MISLNFSTWMNIQCVYSSWKSWKKGRSSSLDKRPWRRAWTPSENSKYKTRNSYHFDIKWTQMISFHRALTGKYPVSFILHVIIIGFGIFRTTEIKSVKSNVFLWALKGTRKSCIYIFMPFEPVMTCQCFLFQPKIRMYSKYERRTDTRTYEDRRKLYEGVRLDFKYSWSRRFFLHLINTSSGSQCDPGLGGYPSRPLESVVEGEVWWMAKEAKE